MPMFTDITDLWSFPTCYFSFRQEWSIVSVLKSSDVNSRWPVIYLCRISYTISASSSFVKIRRCKPQCVFFGVRCGFSFSLSFQYCSVQIPFDVLENPALWTGTSKATMIETPTETISLTPTATTSKILREMITQTLQQRSAWHQQQQ